METLGNKFGGDSAAKFYCESCDYSTCRKCHFDDHLISLRHCKRKQMETNGNTIVGKTSVHCNICETCCKEFSSRSGLWKHKQKCNISEYNSNFSEEHKTNNNMITGLTEQMVIELIKQNSEILKQNQDLSNKIIEITEKNSITHNNSHNTTHTNSHNKAFNLQFFLNETCKEAMNIGEFVDSLKIQLSDLEHIGEAGYIEGITNIIVKNLKELDVTKRPVHCTDKKRETVYIKDNNIWEKDEDKSKMHKLIKKVVSKNTKMFAKFKEAHPDCLTYHSKFSEQYNKIIYESMGGKGDDDDIKNEKIIKNVLKEVVVNKGPDSDS